MVTSSVASSSIVAGPRPRRIWVRATSLALLAAVVAVGAALAMRPAPVVRPDIILIVWDTCRGDRVSANGYAQDTTPRLTAFAADGVTFLQCRTPSPWTPPAHASIFTGLIPRHHGLREGRGAALLPDVPPIAVTLRDAGYECAAFVANPFLRLHPTLAAGFDPMETIVVKGEGKGEGTEVLRRARMFLDGREARGERRPLFLVINMMECHLRYTVDDQALGALGATDGGVALREKAGRINQIDALSHNAGIRRQDADVLTALSALYDGSVRTADRLTGAFLDDLRDRGMLESSFVAVVGDHGENLGEDGSLDHQLSVSDQVVHVPLVVRWPGSMEGGRRVDVQVRTHDLYPTMLDAAGVSVPKRCGKDAVSLLENPVRARPLVAEYGPAPAMIPVLVNEASSFKLSTWEATLLLVREPDGPGARKLRSVVRIEKDGTSTLEKEEMFDPVADPLEERNLLLPPVAPEEKAAAERLRALGANGGRIQVR